MNQSEHYTEKNKEVIFAISGMRGGGAERVISLLANEFCSSGIKTTMVLSSIDRKDVVDSGSSKEVPLVLLQENIKKTLFSRIRYFFYGVFSRTLCKVYQAMHKKVPSVFAYRSFVSQYYSEIAEMRRMFKSAPNASVIVFLQPTIPIVLLAARGLPNRIIISERADPYRLLRSRYGERFIKKYYKRADHIVFQTSDAYEAYPSEVKANSSVILNPIKDGLPEPYIGKRDKVISTFCRISLQKNLPMLIEAFAIFHKKHPEYRLRIIGDAVNEEGRAVDKHIREMVKERNLSDNVEFLPFSSDVHNRILRDMVYVNSSDYEGISNAMLEALAIGVPSICTDCPIGGARATIRDGENGLLVPVGDADALAEAMSKIADDEESALRMSKNGTRIREELSLKRIAQKWTDLI